MYFSSLNEFLVMGGHGLYVWMAYGIFLAIIAWNIFMVRANRKHALERARKTWQREGKGTAAGNKDPVEEASS